MWSQLSTKRRLIALPLLAILLSNAAFAGTAVAAPQIWVSGADLERDATLVGESVGVEVQLHNRGSGGALTLSIEANGSEITSERVQVEGDSSKEVVLNVSFDEPGQYSITAKGKAAGTVAVTKLRVTSVTQRDDGRTSQVRAGAIEAGEPLTANVPDTGNQSFALQRVTMIGSGSAFNRTVSTYAPVDGAPFSVANSDESPVIAAIEMDAVSGVNTSSMRVGIDRDAIRESGVGADEIRIYRKGGGSYTELDTEQATTTEDTIVYEASTDGGTQFVVGSLAAQFDVRSTTLGSEDAPGGQRIKLTPTVANDGPVSGEYVAEMRVDGVTVDQQTVTIASGESTAIPLDHTVDQKGEYQVSLGAESAGSVVLTSDAVADDEASTESEREGSKTEASDESLLDAAPSLPALGNISVLELGIGSSIALVGGGLILLLRR